MHRKPDSEVGTEVNLLHLAEENTERLESVDRSEAAIFRISKLASETKKDKGRCLPPVVVS